MDPIVDLPAVTAEPGSQTAHASNPTPWFPSNGAHPPYAEMIITAITALKDKDGSSRQAIAKYIEKEYANLPSSHSNLLTRHLKLLKNQGQLMMVKHSYMLPSPRSVPFQPSTPTMEDPMANYSNTATDTFPTTAGVNPENSSSRPKRKPGRPPKPRHDSGFQVQGQPPDGQPAIEIQLYQPQFEHHSGAGQDFQCQSHFGASGQDHQPHYGSGQEFQENFQGGADPIFVSLGLADDGVAIPSLPPTENAVASTKRGRGRPPKGAGISGPVATSSGGDDAGSGGGGVVEAGKRGRRRKFGRPKLISLTMVNGGGAKTGIGRPKRIGGPVAVPLSGNVMRPRGKAKRVVSRQSGSPARNASVNGGDGESGSVSRGRGRPPKTSGQANEVRDSISQPFGRLSKVGPGTAVLVTEPEQLVAYQELKFKYEHLQSKAKEVLSVIKPYINSDYAACGTLQELETMVGTDTNV